MPIGRTRNIPQSVHISIIQRVLFFVESEKKEQMMIDRSVNMPVDGQVLPHLHVKSHTSTSLVDIPLLLCLSPGEQEVLLRTYRSREDKPRTTTVLKESGGSCSNHEGGDHRNRKMKKGTQNINGLLLLSIDRIDPCKPASSSLLPPHHSLPPFFISFLCSFPLIGRSNNNLIQAPSSLPSFFSHVFAFWREEERGRKKK